MVRRDDVPYLFAFHTFGDLMIPADIRVPLSPPRRYALAPPLRRGDATTRGALSLRSYRRTTPALPRWCVAIRLPGGAFLVAFGGSLLLFEIR